MLNVANWNLVFVIRDSYSQYLSKLDLVYRGQLLIDGKSLESYNIREKSTVYLLPKRQDSVVQDIAGIIFTVILYYTFILRCKQLYASL